MNSKQRMQALTDGKQPDMVPIFPKISFATIKSVPGMNFHDYTTNPEHMANAIISSARKYGYDAVGITTDIANEGMALGSIYERPADRPSKMVRYLLDTIDDYEKVVMADPMSKEPTRTIIRATELVKKEIGDEFYITSWCNGPLNVASQLIPLEEVLIGMIDDPDTLHELLERCLQFSMRYAKMLVEAGADAVSFGHAMASCTVISRDRYREFALPYETRLVQAIHEAGGKAITHICGNIEPIITDVDTNGSDIIDFDHLCDPVKILQSSTKIIRGNLDPVLFSNGTPEELYEETSRVVELCKGSGRFILGSGCEITENASEENIRAFVRAGRDHGKYE